MGIASSWIDLRDDVMAAAILDRLLHHSHTLLINGESYRLRPPSWPLRLRLRADFDVSRYTGQARGMLNAMRRYGLIVADTGAN